MVDTICFGIEVEDMHCVRCERTTSVRATRCVSSIACDVQNILGHISSLKLDGDNKQSLTAILVSVAFLSVSFQLKT